MFKSLDNPSHTMCQEAQRKPSGGESGSTKEAQQFVPGVVRQHKGSATMCAGDSGSTKEAQQFVPQYKYILPSNVICAHYEMGEHFEVQAHNASQILTCADACDNDALFMP